ncbi:MAG: hypothetical protein NC412_10110 [Roseburia sp.]|nr:hypothetical protein [Roseburia sp.]MCM1277515.1 hypothetical protein [Robinsoniella sp.]
MSWDSLPGLCKVVGPYAPYFGALVPLRLCRAKACPEDYPMTCRLPRPFTQKPIVANFVTFIEENYQKYWIFLPKYGKMKKAVITKQKSFVK